MSFCGSGTSLPHHPHWAIRDRICFNSRSLSSLRWEARTSLSSFLLWGSGDRLSILAYFLAADSDTSTTLAIDAIGATPRAPAYVLYLVHVYHFPSDLSYVTDRSDDMLGWVNRRMVGISIHEPVIIRAQTRRVPSPNRKPDLDKHRCSESDEQ